MTGLATRSRAMRIASFVLGAGLLVWLVLSSGVGSIIADLAKVGPGVLVILLIEFGAHALNTLGWWFTLPKRQRAGTYGWLYWVRAAGQAINESTPMASLGGEPAKMVLLRSRVSTGAAAASLLASKVSFCVAKALFIILGMAFVWSRLDLPPKLSLALLVAFFAMVGGIAAFAVIQMRGIGAGTVAVLQRLGLPVRWMARVEASLHEVDAHLKDFYLARPGDLLRSVAAHGCAFACGVLQIALLLDWLALPFDLAAAVGIEAFAALISLVTFIVPGSLGVQEGGKVLIFAALGLPRPAAMAVGITFRLITLLDIAVGLAAFALLRQHRPLPDRAARRDSSEAVP
ncbi:MAG TPA: flippase-like domain-containing protein [Candidatus Methylomirabilis sp.]|nr:flippase-like domain-containing protein [Candidatus Methylomirabilis sp.]